MIRSNPHISSGSNHGVQSVDFATDVAFTFSTGTEPVDGDGCYDDVTGFTVTPTGRMDARVPPAAAPFFTLTYDACLQ